MPSSAWLPRADQLRVVEVVAGVHADALGQPLAQRDLLVRVQQRDLDAIDLGHVGLDDPDDRVERGLEVRGAPVSGELRVEHLAQPVQDHRRRRGAQQLAVDRAVVVGARSRRAQRARGHQDHRRALALDELELLRVRAADVVQRRGTRELVGAGAGGELSADGLRLRHRAPDQLLRRGPVQAHPALRGVHRLRHPQAVRPQVPAEVQRRLPVQLRRTGGIAARERIGDHVRRREAHARARLGAEHRQRLARERLIRLEHAAGAGKRDRHSVSSGTSTQRRSRHDCSPSS